MTDIYFNGRSWRRLGLSEQDVKFLERLSTALKTLETSTDTDSSSLSNLTVTVNTLSGAVDDLENAADTTEASTSEETDTNMLYFEITRLRKRIEELESA